MDQTEDKATYPRDFIKLKSPSGCEDVHYSLFYEELPEQYRLLAQKILNETEDNKQNGLKKLRSFVQKEKLPPCKDYEIIGALRCTKYNIKKAETKLKKYLKFRQSVQQLLASMDEEKAELILEDIMFGFLPYRDRQGRAILFTRPNLRLNLYQMEDIKPLAFAALLYIYSFPMTTVCGFSYIMEAKTDNLFIYYPIFKAYRGFLSGFMDVPIRYGRADGVNENPLITCFYAALRPLLPEKITKRVFFHGKGYESLKKLYHPDILPEDFEGNLEPINNKYFKGRLLNFIKKLKAENEITDHSNG